jgi:hypothetical protein
MAYTPYVPATGSNQGGIVQPTDVPSITPQPQHPVPYGQDKWIEPNWDLPTQAPAPSAQQAAGMPPITNPIELAQWHDQQENSQLGQFDQQLAAIQAPVQSALTTSYDQYKIDFAAIQNSQMDAQQKADRLQQLNASYQKKWIGLKGKTQLEEQAIQQQKQQAAFNLKLQQAMRMKEIQTYAGMAERGEISPESALRLQYKALGYDVPVTDMRPPKSQNPIDQLKDLRVVIDTADDVLKRFQYNEKKGELRIVKPPEEWATNKFDQKKDTRLATHMERLDYFQTRYGKQQALAAQAQLRQQALGIRVRDIVTGGDPLSSSIRAAKPSSTSTPQPQAAADVSSLSTEELLRLAGGQ